tara:strand:- start:3171 stop:4013 length:843 start_codon:yes stop_codon:yes gene_type:complete
MPRNEERLGIKDEGTNPPIQVDGTNSSPLSFVTPTEFVDLPTKGKFYPEDHPLHNQETIEIRFMTAKDEDILTSKTLLKKGVAVDRMLTNIIIDKRIKVEDLFIGDKNALIIASRISGYGAEYKTSVTCLSCGSSSEHVFDLSEVEVKEFTEGEIEISDAGTFTVELPKTKVVAECRLVTGKEEKVLATRLEKRKKHKLPEAALTGQLKMFLVSLNGETDKGVIDRFVDSMPALDSKYLRAMYEAHAPNVDMKHLYECDKCSAETTIDMPFSVNFFWPNG